MKDGIIFVKGKRIDQRKLRKFLEEIDFDNIDQFETPEGKWRSPVSGDLFDTKHQLWGQLGAYLRNIDRKDPMEPTRAGYVRALRRGLEPTPAQKKAHAEYAKVYRRRRRAKILKERGLDVPEEKAPDPEPERVRVPEMSWD